MVLKIPPFILSRIFFAGESFGVSSAMNTKSNRGRKRKPFWFAAEKRYIDGLRLRPSDGRWEVVSTGKMAGFDLPGIFASHFVPDIWPVRTFQPTG